MNAACTLAQALPAGSRPALIGYGIITRRCPLSKNCRDGGGSGDIASKNHGAEFGEAAIEMAGREPDNNKNYKITSRVLSRMRDLDHKKR